MNQTISTWSQEKEADLSLLYIQNSTTQSISDHIKSDPLWATIEPETLSGQKNGPTRAEILLQLGILYWRRGNHDRSEQLLIKASEVAEKEKDIKFLAQCLTALALVKNSLEKTEDAITAYEQVSELAPENFHIWNNLGKLYAQGNHHVQAIDAYKKALNVVPDNIVAWTGLANAHYQSKNVDEAIRAYKQLITLVLNTNIQQKNEQIILSWLRLAKLYTIKCQYQEAIMAYQRVLSFEHDKSKTWKMIGALYIKVDKYDKALEAFTNAIELDPNCGKSFLELANLYTKLGRYRESIPAYMKSIEKLSNPQDIQMAIVLLENAKYMVNKNKSITPNKRRIRYSTYNAVTWFYYEYNNEVTTLDLSNPANRLAKHAKGEKGMAQLLPILSRKRNQLTQKDGVSLTQNPEVSTIDAVDWNKRGNTHFKHKAYDDAINAYYKAIGSDPSFGQPYNNLALIQFILGNFGESILLYQKSINLLDTDKEKAIAWNGLGNTYRCIKDYESARLAYQTASELDPKNGGVYDSTITHEAGEKYKTAQFWSDLGSYFFKTGIYDKAVSAFQEAIQLEPSSGPAYGHLARALTAQGKYQEAVSFYHKSIDLIPNNTEKASMWNRLGDVHRKLNDYDNALQAYQNGTTLSDKKVSLLSRTRFSLLSNCATKQ